MLDTFKHKGMRNRLIDGIAEKGISDARVLAAMRLIPRHLFVESALADVAYEDRALPIADGQTISQPFTVAYQTQLLDLQENQKILEIGTGSGYQCAVLCKMGVKVYTIEFSRKLFQASQRVLAELDLAPTMLCGDGSEGWAKYMPFDRIIVTAACPSIPDVLVKQLVIGGKMVFPMGARDTQEMCLLTKTNNTEYQIQRLEKFKFVPLLGKNGFQK